MRPQKRSTGLLPEEAKAYLIELFEEGEENSREKVRLILIPLIDFV